MSYLFGQPYEHFKLRVRKKDSNFKPSFEKLMKAHGLSSPRLLNWNYEQLLEALGSDTQTLETFIKYCTNFQEVTAKTNFDKYATGLISTKGSAPPSANMIPQFLIPPYFLMDDRTIRLNLKILKIAKKQRKKNIFPMMYIKYEDLGSDFERSTSQKMKAIGFEGYCLWVDGFDESKASQDKIENYIDLVHDLSEGGKKRLILMYGGFFSLVLNYFGVDCVCHGILYGESRTSTAAALRTAGAPPIRYYIPSLHRFVSIDKMTAMLEHAPELLCDCPVCTRLTYGLPENIGRFAEQEGLSEIHFMYSRLKERGNIAHTSPDDIAKHLRMQYDTYKDLAEIEDMNMNFSYLMNWSKAISNKAKELL